jgi:pimeloyl-ACP methyl ester carboxylesterase
MEGFLMFFRSFFVSAALAAIALPALPAVAADEKGAEPKKAECPAALPKDADCFAGQDETGAYYWMARPKNWNGILVVHSHGGPRTAKPKPDDAVEDLERFAVTVDEGYAWVGSNYRRPGYGVRMAAADTDNVRKIAEGFLGNPRLVLLHGQSWGGNVAAKTAELYAIDPDGHKNYDGVVLTSGVLGGGTYSYKFRADLRAVYQYYCKNHPRADEVQYPVWQGLPKEGKMKREDLEERVNECTGISQPKDKRTPEQAKNLKNILAVTHVPERTLVAHLSWATGLFHDMVWKRLDGKNPFDNSKTVYAGSDDDAALNKGVERFTADPQGVRLLAYDADLTGEIVLPTITMHAKNDPTAFVPLEAHYRDVVEKAGNGDLLVQNFTDEAEHSKLSTPQYAALFSQMVDWIDKGEKPTRQTVAAVCEEKSKVYKEPCRFLQDFQPQLGEQ